MRYTFGAALDSVKLNKVVKKFVAAIGVAAIGSSSDRCRSEIGT